MFNKSRGPKAQSAMEYLMTYGWAILIIAIVLAALFALGVFSSSSFIGTACIAASGYECASPLLHAGSFAATVGQSTGTTWATANIILITGGGAANAIANTPSPSACGLILISGGLTSGQTVSFSATNSMTVSSSTATCNSALPTAVGSSVSGALWAEYTVSGTSGQLWSQIATVTLKAT